MSLNTVLVFVKGCKGIKILFYAQEELNILYKELKQIPYDQKNEWQKYLDKEHVKKKSKDKTRRKKEHLTGHIEHYKQTY